MIYDKYGSGNGVWHCPFPPEWVEMMKRAVNSCKYLSEAQIDWLRDVRDYRLPPGDFLSEPQDARGLPLSWCKEYERRHENWPQCCVAIYDYDTIPDLVVTNGSEDWPLTPRFKKLQA